MRKSGRQNRKEQDKTRNNEKKQTRMEQNIQITRQDVRPTTTQNQSTVGNKQSKKARCKLMMKQNRTENIETT